MLGLHGAIFSCAYATQFVALHAPEKLYRVAMKIFVQFRKEFAAQTCNKID